MAYGFQARFIVPILGGRKAQTIRRPRKRHARPGEAMQLYTALRTRHCRLIARAVCWEVRGITVDLTPEAITAITVDGDRPVTGAGLEVFAAADGFDGIADMTAFWLKHHHRAILWPDGVWQGVLIRWHPGIVAAWPAPPPPGRPRDERGTG